MKGNESRNGWKEGLTEGRMEEERSVVAVVVAIRGEKGCSCGGGH